MAEQDVVAFAGTASAPCARPSCASAKGRLADKREFLFHDTQDIPALRDEFLPRYYLEDTEFIPQKHCRGRAARGRAASLQRLLAETRGVQGAAVCAPARRHRPSLVEMARTNAVERLGAGERALCPRADALWTKRPRLLGA